MEINSKEFDLGQVAEDASPELGELLQIDELRSHTSTSSKNNPPPADADEEDWSRCEHENVERKVSAETFLAEGEAIADEGMKAARALEKIDKKQKKSPEYLGGTYRVITEGYRLGLWAEEHPEEFKTLLETYNVSAKSNAGRFVLPFKLILRGVRVSEIKSNVSKYSSCCELAANSPDNITPESLTDFLKNGHRGWTNAYKAFAKSRSQEREEQKREKESQKARKLKSLKQDAVPFAPLPANDEKGISPCEGYDGVGLLVFRWSPDGKTGILGRLMVDPKKAEEIILRHGVDFPDDELNKTLDAVANANQEVRHEG